MILVQIEVGGVIIGFEMRNEVSIEDGDGDGEERKEGKPS